MAHAPTPSLADALDAVAEALGADHKDLVEQLRAAAPADQPDKAPARDGEDDDYSFKTATKRHTERTAAAKKAEAEPDAADDAEATEEEK